MSYLQFLFSLLIISNGVFAENAKKYDTIVLGLGAAGAMASKILTTSGVQVLALEAQDRVGGRVCTRQFGDGIVEVGAEWIHGTEDSITYGAAQKNSIDIKIQKSEVLAYRSNGSVGDSPLVQDLIGKSDVVLGPGKPAQPLGQYVTASIKDYLKKVRPEVLEDEEYLKELLDVLDRSQCTMDGCSDWTEVSTASNYEDLGGSKVASWHRHGYKTFFDIVLNKYQNGTGIPNLEIKLSSEVTKIKIYQNESVHVTTQNGDVYVADNVIVTFSIGVLKEKYSTMFDPPLSQEKVTAIENLAIGTVDKVILSFKEVWWPQDKIFPFVWRAEERQKVSEEDSWLTKVFGASTSMGASNVLEFWITGEAAKKMENLSENVVQNKIMWLARLFMGKDKVIPEPEAMLRSTWFSNPYTRGSYTYDNQSTANHTQLRNKLGQPVYDGAGNLRLLFAGEGMNPVHYGTVHGAAETGVREAIWVIDDRKLKNGIDDC